MCSFLSDFNKNLISINEKETFFCKGQQRATCYVPEGPLNLGVAASDMDTNQPIRIWIPTNQSGYHTPPNTNPSSVKAKKTYFKIL